MGKHVPPISFGGMKLSNSIGFDRPIEVFAITNRSLYTAKGGYFSLSNQFLSGQIRIFIWHQTKIYISD